MDEKAVGLVLQTLMVEAIRAMDANRISVLFSVVSEMLNDRQAVFVSKNGDTTDPSNYVTYAQVAGIFATFIRFAFTKDQIVAIEESVNKEYIANDFIKELMPTLRTIHSNTGKQSAN
jgi:hypothetical protein